MTDGEDTRSANEAACQRGARRHADAITAQERRELRDYFAAAALTGLAAVYAPDEGSSSERREQRARLAASAYLLADAMLAEREGR